MAVKQIVLDDYRKNGESEVEAFITSYLELLGSGLTHEEIEKEYSWVEENLNYYPDDNGWTDDEYNTVFVIEDVEAWFCGRRIDPRGIWTNQDVRNVFDGKCTKKFGNYAPHDIVDIDEIVEYKGVKYVKVYKLFFSCLTYLIKTPDDRVFSIWY